tara:strand:+ start:401 stop:574 length:174 start_codon:yes stop_codon:yes gene_type:complete
LTTQDISQPHHGSLVGRIALNEQVEFEFSLRNTADVEQRPRIGASGLDVVRRRLDGA